MRYTTKKILPYVTLPIILSLPIQSGFAAETILITEGVKQRFSKGALQTESGPGKTLNHETPTLPETTTSWTWQQSLESATGMTWLFATSLLEPFITDAPKALATIRGEGEKLKEQGIISYTLTLGKHAGKVVADNPLDSIIMAGAMVLGHTNIAEYSDLVPLTVGIVGGVRNGKVMYDLAHSIDGHTVIEKSLQVGLYGLAIYAAASLPVSYALSTVTLGTQFQINQNSLSSGSPTSTAGLTNGNVVIAWRGISNNMVARIFNPHGTAITNEFNMSAVAPPAPVVPSVIGLSDGNWFATWQNGSSILSRIFYGNGMAVTNPFTTNQATYVSLGNSIVAPFTNGNVLVGWSGSSAGNYAIEGRIFSPNGIALSNEITIYSLSTQINGPSLASLENGSVLALLSKSGTILGAEVMSNATVGNLITINQTPSSGPSVAGLAGGNAMAVYLHGNDQILGRVIQNGMPKGNELVVLNGTTNIAVPSIAGSTDGDTALVVWQGVDTQINNLNVYGIGLSVDGTPQTNSFIIPADTSGDGSPSVTAITNSQFFVSWIGGSNQLYGRTISFSTGPSPMPGIPSPSASSPSVIPASAPSMLPSSVTPTTVPTASPTSTPIGIPTVPTVPTVTPTIPPSSPPTSGGTPPISPGTPSGAPVASPVPAPASKPEIPSGLPSPASAPTSSAQRLTLFGLMHLPVNIFSGIFSAASTMVQSVWKWSAK